MVFVPDPNYPQIGFFSHDGARFSQIFHEYGEVTEKPAGDKSYTRRAGQRTGLLGVTTHVLGDTDMKWKDWVHVTKLDPDKQLKPGDIDAIATSGTDALMLSGTLNVTKGELGGPPEADRSVRPPPRDGAGRSRSGSHQRDRLRLCAQRDEHDRRAVDCRQAPCLGAAAERAHPLGHGRSRGIYRLKPRLLGGQSDKGGLRSQRPRGSRHTLRLPTGTSTSRSSISNTRGPTATRRS